MNVSSRVTNKQLRIRIENHFNFSVYPEFRQAYRDISPQAIDQIEVDIQDVTYIDSAALGMLLLLGEHFSGTRIQITHASQFVKQVLDIANFGKKFDIQ